MRKEHYSTITDKRSPLLFYLIKNLNRVYPSEALMRDCCYSMKYMQVKLTMKVLSKRSVIGLP